MTTNINEIIGIINKYDSFLIVSHINPDGDAIGSQFALKYLLEDKKKKALVVNSEPIPFTYSFLGKWICPGELKSKPNFEVAIALDSADLKRLGKTVLPLLSDKILINIDHHVSNGRFGRINWIDSEASATGEMIYHLYKKMDCKISKDAALALYVAILTDTGLFRYTNTDSTTHDIASELLKIGIDPHWVAERIYGVNSLASMKLLALALSTIKVNDDGRIGWLCVRSDMLEKTGASFQDTGDFVNYARSIRGLEVAIFFSETETKDEIKISFRSKDKTDVNVIAKNFQGGGHPQASGCRVKGKLDEVIPMVIAEVQKALR